MRQVRDRQRSGGEQQLRRVYSRQQFADAWLESGSDVVAYLVYPKGWKVPEQPYSGGSW